VRRRVFLIALVVAVASVMVFGGTALAGKPSLRTAVTAQLESADGSLHGTALLHLYPTKNKICYRLDLDNTVQPGTPAHLHRGSVDETTQSKPVLNLRALNSGECIRGLGERFIRNVKRHPGNYYVDVHTANPDDLRGQLEPAGP
jgi:CHRD domain-containing protein